MYVCTVVISAIHFNPTRINAESDTPAGEVRKSFKTDHEGAGLDTTMWGLNTLVACIITMQMKHIKTGECIHVQYAALFEDNLLYSELLNRQFLPFIVFFASVCWRQCQSISRSIAVLCLLCAARGMHRSSADAEIRGRCMTCMQYSNKMPGDVDKLIMISRY